MTTSPGRLPRIGIDPGKVGGLTEESRYWNQVTREWLRSSPQELWRVHADLVNVELCDRWLPEKDGGRLLKTDLFDEAFGQGIYPFLVRRADHFVGMDLSSGTVTTARSRYLELPGLAADARSLPFVDQAFDLIVSNSTLDHFGSLSEIKASLGELGRILRPEGHLLITVDNLSNPIVALRAVLPFRWLNRLGLVPYYVGQTLGQRGLCRFLEEAGFEVERVGAIMHCPRVLAVALSRTVQRLAGPRGQSRYLRALRVFERLSGWPTRYLTGHFVAVLARRR